MSASPISTSQDRYQQEVKQELNNICRYWMQFSPDTRNGGFVGRIDNDNHIDALAPKGSVLNARILWSFSAAYNLEKDKKLFRVADEAFNYLADHFIDKEFGGVYWTVNASGEPLDTKKQVYAIAFTIYALSEYYLAGKNEEVRELAIRLYQQLVEKSFDREKTGYFEAFTRDWKEIEDLRLSAKDANEKKTMNTHLHVLEAYTILYKIWKDEGLKEQIGLLIQNFLQHIIDGQSGHLILFFDENWTRKSETISYGHDIEAAWLLLEAAEVIEDEQLIGRVKEASIKMADAAAEGLSDDGSLYYEYEPSEQHLIKEKHWWVQAEAMVGFFNAYQLSRESGYLEKSIQVWEFIQSSILDKRNGEWFWGVLEDGSVMPGQDKVGLWKCPYHNSRACIEIYRRIEHLKG
ncbi:AGE family epimerase/isomerase [Pedobacter sp. SYSU D00535]|uniref:AGE family epimerase/isomerase n=1 Tax=Pedobacter sp. SYSU D00535 TaxID=2810308 RepID=UPI001A95E8E7|nr:AGE family epimerase/isomerase [Pedobacter sp. SYSU D00535]